MSIGFYSSSSVVEAIVSSAGGGGGGADWSTWDGTNDGAIASLIPRSDAFTSFHAAKGLISIGNNRVLFGYGMGETSTFRGCLSIIQVSGTSANVLSTVSAAPIGSNNRRYWDHAPVVIAPYSNTQGVMGINTPYHSTDIAFYPYSIDGDTLTLHTLVSGKFKDNSFRDGDFALLPNGEIKQYELGLLYTGSFDPVTNAIVPPYTGSGSNTGGSYSRIVSTPGGNYFLMRNQSDHQQMRIRYNENVEVVGPHILNGSYLNHIVPISETQAAFFHVSEQKMRCWVGTWDSGWTFSNVLFHNTTHSISTLGVCKLNSTQFFVVTNSRTDIGQEIYESEMYGSVIDISSGHPAVAVDSISLTTAGSSLIQSIAACVAIDDTTVLVIFRRGGVSPTSTINRGYNYKVVKL